LQYVCHPKESAASAAFPIVSEKPKMPLLMLLLCRGLAFITSTSSESTAPNSSPFLAFERWHECGCCLFDRSFVEHENALVILSMDVLQQQRQLIIATHITVF
jgi:hypothetical protein